MTRSAQDVLLTAFGAILLQIGLTDLHLRFVKSSMQPLIVAAALALLAIAVTGLVSQVPSRGPRTPSGEVAPPARPGHDGHRGHGHRGHGHGGHGHGEGAPRTCWLLTLPLLVLLLVAPPALGADALSRGASTRPPARSDAYPPLPAPRAGAVDLTIGDYSSRAVFRPETVQGTRLRLLGFAAPHGQGWMLARVSLSCCAADGRAVTVRMTGGAARAVPPADSWYEVTGTWAPPVESDGGVPALDVSSLTAVAAPAQPYAPSS